MVSFLRLLARSSLLMLAGALVHRLLASRRQTVTCAARSRLPLVAAQVDHPPNVLLVLLDDAGAGDAGFLGHPLLRTPHMDDFFRSAISFSHAYAGAPNCSPSRASLLTGRMPFRTGVYDFLSKRSGNMHMAGVETIASVLRSAGYQTVHLGKWHLSRPGLGIGFPPSHFGFEHSNDTYAPASQLVSSFTGWLASGRRERTPFFAYLALWEPHEPVQLWSPVEYQRLYAPTEKRREHDDAFALDSLAPSVRGAGGSCVWRIPRAPARVYYGCLSQVDASFGVLLGALDEAGLRKHSIVMLASDNGPEHRGRHSWGVTGGLRGAKGYVYEGGIRVPLLLRWPAQLRASATVSAPVHFWDVLPTLCDAAGIHSDDVPGHLDGVSLLPLIRAALVGDEASEPLLRPTPLWWGMHRGRGGMQYALRVGEWKLLAGYGRRSDQTAHGPPVGGETSTWLRARAAIIP